MAANDKDDDQTRSFTNLTAGTIISHYTIISKIGAGGMGEVYLAEDTQLDRKVALKFLPPHLSQDEDSRARFTREAKAAAKLDHPNIVPVYEVGEFNGRPFFAMAHIEGKSLREVIKEGKLSISDIIELTKQICEGLHEAHTAGVVHRDIKPGNIIIDRKNKARLVDFGLATVSGEEKLTKTGSTLGTVGYMSPEQVQGEKADHRSDLFSVGVVLYEMITGRLPFDAEHEAAIHYNIVHETPEPIARYKSGTTGELQQIVDKALTKDPSLRYQHADGMLADLKRLQLDPGRKIKSKTIVWVALSGIVILIVGLYLALPRQPARHTVANKRQVTFVGDVFLQDISPDGTLIAYARGRGKQQRRVFVQDLSGGNPLQIYEDKAILELCWSPEGNELLIASKNDSVRGVYIVPRLGGTARRYPIYVYPYSSIDWSPDGQKFVVQNPQQNRKVLIVNKKSGDISSFVIDEPFDWIDFVKWSPNGERLLFWSMSAEGMGLWTINTDGTDLKLLYKGDKLSPLWAHKGDAVYFLESREQTKDLMKLSVKSGLSEAVGEPKVLLASLKIAGKISVSSDQKRLLVLEQMVWSNLWRVDLERVEMGKVAKSTQLTFTTHKIENPAISPDAKWIAFDGPVGDDEQIFKIPLEGVERTQLTYLARSNFFSAWSPDSKQIAFISSDQDVRRVAVVASDGGNMRTYGSTKCSQELYWNPACNILYQRPGNHNFYLLDPETEAESPLVTNDSVGWIFSAHPAPDNHRVAIF